MTNTDLFEYFWIYHKENPEATLCPILGPINFILWLINKDVGYDHSDADRVLTLHNLMLRAIEETPDQEQT